MGSSVKNRNPRLRTKIGGALAAAGLVALGIVAPQIASAAPALQAGDSVWVGGSIGYNGAVAHAVYPQRPADAPDAESGPQSYWEAADFWAYCVEHNISANPGATGVLDDFDGALADSLFTGPNAQLVQAKVMWVLTHSLPVISLDDFHTASGLTNVTTDDLVMATQYAIWRYTDLGFDAEWRAWVDDPATYGNARDAYWYLVNGANADTATAPVVPAPITVSVDAPPAGQEAATLVGPFTVHTNQATVSVTTESGLSIVDAAGNAIDVSAVVDGQQLYLDATGVVDAGSATITATAEGSSATGYVLNVPLDNGSMTPDAHAQTMILAAKSTANTTASADTTWVAVPQPTIGTTLVDSADGDKVLGWNGGTVVDTIAYENLTPGVEYTVTGELMLKSDGSATGITGTTTFTPAEANGTTTVTFAVPAGFGGEVLVAYEELFESADLTTPVAVHQDINDAAQTVTVQTPPTVEEPAIGTSLVDSADADHVLPAEGGTLIDTVAYQNLTVGTEYTITGELMLQGDGTATGVTGTVTFTPVAADGSVEVTFEVPAGFAGEALVAYEELFESTDLTTPVAVHQDINDAAQTVTVEQTTTPTPTPTPTTTPSATPSATPTTTPSATPSPTTTPSATPSPTSTASSPVVPGKPGKQSGPTGLPTTGMDLSPAPFVGAMALLGLGTFILIARRRATSRR